MMKLIKSLYIYFFDRYTAWEIVARNVPYIVRRDGKEEVFLANKLECFDRHKKETINRYVITYEEQFTEFLE